MDIDLKETIKELTQHGPVDVITQSSGFCIISPPGELVSPDAEPGERDYGVRSQRWALLPEGGGWVREYDSLEGLLQAEGQDFIALA